VRVKEEVRVEVVVCEGRERWVGGGLVGLGVRVEGGVKTGLFGCGCAREGWETVGSEKVTAVSPVHH
jgi:hypothetical protein